MFQRHKVLCLIRCCEISQGYHNTQRVGEKKVQDLSRLQGFLGYKKFVLQNKVRQGLLQKSFGTFLIQGLSICWMV